MSMRECEQMCFACPAVCLHVWVWASVCENWCTCDLHVSGHVCAWPGEVHSGREPGLPGSPLLLNPVPPPPAGVLNARALHPVPEILVTRRRTGTQLAQRGP